MSELDDLYGSVTNMQNLARIHETRAKVGRTNQTAAESSLSGTLQAWKLYGIEHGIDFTQPDPPPVKDLTVAGDSKRKSPQAKLKPLPVSSRSFRQRGDQFGAHPPVPRKDQPLAMAGDDPPARSILPWTPHPVHDAPVRATRKLNRTGSDKTQDTSASLGWTGSLT